MFMTRALREKRRNEEFRMTAAIVSTYTAAPGRRPEVVKILQDTIEYVNTKGGQSHVRQSFLAGEGTGALILLTQYASPSDLWEGMDLLAADVANNPLAQGFLVADPPGVLGTRYTSSTLTDDATVPAPAAVVGYTAFQVTPGKREEARAAFAAAEERHAGIGFATRAIQIDNAGPASGTIAYAVPAGSYAEFGSFLPKNQEIEGVGPLGTAIQAGTIARAAQLVTGLAIS
jgi:hypothetical protein